MLLIAVALGALIGLFAVLFWMKRQEYTFSQRVFWALGLGLLLGGFLHVFLDESNIVVVKDWYGLFGNGYVQLLQMIAMPLIFISILSSLTRMSAERQLAGTAGRIIAWLVGLTAIAALIGIISANLFGLDASQIIPGEAELSRGNSLIERAQGLEAQTWPQRLLALLPTNPFLDLTGARPTSTIATVIFAALLGVSYLGISEKHPKEAATFRAGVEALHAIVMQLVRIVLQLTPYGVLAILAATVASTNYAAIWDLGKFVIASYAALAAMLSIQLGALAAFGLSPQRYFNKASPVLLFAFSSRSSAATLPFNIETQHSKLGVEEGTANLAASLGTSIGQNACAGIYPAMLATMIAPTVGINPLDPAFIGTLVATVALSSFGVAGVGGGATFAAILVLSAMNLPIALAGILISIEPLIDMGRTAINVSGAMVAGTLTSRQQGTLNLERYRSR